MNKISIIIPAYNEGAVIKKTADRVKEVLADKPHEIIFVDDGSSDNTWQEISVAAEFSPDENKKIAGIKLSRNFGKEGAMLAGLAHARGAACVIMDCDLQHPPEILPQMIEKWRVGNVDIVEGVKNSRGAESWLYKIFSALFYLLLGRMGKMKLSNASDFQLLDRRVVDIILQMPERQRFFRALSSWVGFNREKIFFTVAPRTAGKSKFNFFSSTKYALNNIASFSSAPLHWVTFMGAVFFVAAVGLGVHTMVGWARGAAVEGFTTVILLLLIIGAMLMFSLGILGFFIGKIYEEIKYRPPYLVQSTVNLESGEN